MIVGPHPVGRIALHLFNRFEQVVTEPVVADRPVVAFDVGILLRVARLDVIQPDAFAFSPGDEGALMYSGLLSLLMTCGLPRHSMI